MTYYTCEYEWEAMLSCIYDAWSSKKGHQNIKLLLEPVEQYTLFDSYIHVDSDPQKAERVSNAVCQKISAYVYRRLAYCAMSCEKDVLDTIYRVMILGFAYGPNVLDMVQYKDIMHFSELTKRVGSDVCRFTEILRFHEVENHVYVAHIEPKCRVITAIAPHFMDRMPSEQWMIVDDIRREAVLYNGNELMYMRLTVEELDHLLRTENENDHFTDLWKVFYESIAIKERENPTCQRSHFPIWARKHAVEFQ